MGTPQQLLERLLTGILRMVFPLSVLVAVGVFLLLFLGRVGLISSYHHDLGGVEPNIIYGVQQLLDGKPLYSDPNQPPYAVVMYSPLYFHFTAAIGRLTNVNPHEPIEVYRISRSVAFFFNLVFIGMLLLILVRHFNIRVLVAMVVCSLVFSYLRITDFGRPDSLYHLMALMTMAGFLEYLKTEQQRWWVLASVLSVVSIFAKQSGLIVPFILLFYLMFYGNNFRQLLQTLGIMVISFAVLWLLFSGDSYVFWQNVYQGVSNGVSWDWFKRRILFFYMRELALFAGLVLALSALFLVRDYSNSKKFVGVAVLGFFFFALLTSLKWGSMPSYFTPFLTMGWIGITAWLYSDQQTIKYHQDAVFGLVALCCFATEVPHKYNTFRDKEDTTAYYQSKQVANYLKEEANIQPTDHLLALVDKQYLMEKHFLNNFLFQHAILPSKDIFTCCSYPLKKFDYSILNKQAEHGLIKYLVRNKNASKATFFHFKFQDYEKIKVLDGYEVYRYLAPKK